MNPLSIFDLRKPPMRLFSFFNIPVYLSRWTFPFYLLIAVSVSLAISDKFAEETGTTVTFAYLFNIAMFLLVFLVINTFVLIHEFGHALTAQKLGIDCDAIVMYPIGGCAFIDVPYNRPREEFWVTFNGPLTNAIFAVIFYPLCLLFDGDSFLFNLFHFLGLVNLILLLFNLLPVHPMDGGRLLRSTLQLAFKMKPLEAAETTHLVGVVVSAISSVFLFLWGFYLGGLIVLFCGLVLSKHEVERVILKEDAEYLKKIFPEKYQK